MNFTIRKLRQPEDFQAVAPLVNLVWSEPTTAERLQEDEDKIPPGQLHYNEQGELMGWDRPKWVAEHENGQIIAYAIAWRAPWTEPGALIHTLIVHPEFRGKGVGTAIYGALHAWAQEVKASRLMNYNMKETDESSLAFAEKRGYIRERLTFESVLDLGEYAADERQLASIGDAERSGIRFVTLAEEPGEDNERKLHELYQITHRDIPGYTGEYPWFEEWKKWTLGLPGVRPEWIHIAKDGERYVGVVSLQHNEQTGAMYHEYTGVLPQYRGRRIALALKLLGMQSAKAAGAPYLRTHNDSANIPMLRVNRDLMGFRAEPGSYKIVCTL
ncbi:MULTISPECIES: GNAT family N-acetyltransferase [unclassified Paenibacillus]|uniref:GNAT family N-acetyltransferase n=1 Tax=unclassified Paenibacillus TaxID=185978 RepID=UPI00104AEC8F|nr:MULTISPECIES: GNAT family N-acetyltransferase [unclassified Paenibacillus]NIK71337.1 GNAT superfamily N-acetyltransferase [Paenibacillus sp. BK720]TCM96946.1 acetyltransferase (GNAT) family protein [Paenibacillus sp. BK033]